MTAPTPGPDAVIAAVEALDADMRGQWERARAGVTAPPVQRLNTPKSGMPGASPVPSEWSSLNRFLTTTFLLRLESTPFH